MEVPAHNSVLTVGS